MIWDWESIIFHSAAFVSAIALFQYGAQIFIKRTVLLARNLGVLDTVVYLIPTIASELEELAIVLSVIILKKPSLGLGNIIGATIGNVLGAFSLVLIFHGGRMDFDSGARVFALVSFLMTSIFCILNLKDYLDIQGGILLVVAFTVYIFSIASAIYEGMIQAHHLMDSNHADFQRSTDITVEEEESSSNSLDEEIGGLKVRIFPSVMHCHPTEQSPLLLGGSSQQDPAQSTSKYHSSNRNVSDWGLNHIAKIFLGGLALCLSGFVATYSVGALAAALNLSEYLAGMTILSFATPIPERLLKFSYTKNLHSDLLMASTAGTNIVLLTLCIGTIIIVGSENGYEVISLDVSSFELWICWICSLVLLLIAWIGGKPYIGGILIVCYLTYLGCELTLFKR